MGLLDTAVRAGLGSSSSSTTLETCAMMWLRLNSTATAHEALSTVRDTACRLP